MIVDSSATTAAPASSARRTVGWTVSGLTVVIIAPVAARAAPSLPPCCSLTTVPATGCPATGAHHRHDPGRRRVGATRPARGGASCARRRTRGHRPVRAGGARMTGEALFDGIRVERSGAVATIWLDRPAKRNAMSYAMWAGLEAACREVGADSRI